MTAYTIEEMAIGDYDQILSLWESCKGIGLGPSDSRPRIASYLDRNKGMSFVAWHEGCIIGAVLGGTDGRRGFISHLAVAEDFRCQGIGKELAQHCLEAFRQEGLLRCSIMIFANNAAGIAFWRKLGWRLREELRYAVLDL